jgi:phage tail sheath protein FI
MPQYLAPGVYVEEIPGPRTIAGVSTSTAAFVGPTRFGPTSGQPELLTSYLDFGRIYGDAVDLEFSDNGESTNFMALGVKGFFDEGGTSLYVVRTFSYTGETPAADHAFADTPSTGSDPGIRVRARFPGLAGRVQATFTIRAGNNVLVPTSAGNLMTRVHEFDLVWASPTAGSPALYVVRRNAVTGDLYLAGQPTTPDLDALAFVHPLTVVVDVQKPTVNSQGLPAYGPPTGLGEFGFDPRAVGTGISTVLAPNPPTHSQALTIPIALEGIDGLAATDADELPVVIALTLFGAGIADTLELLLHPPSPASTPVTIDELQLVVGLDGGSDGNAPAVGEYEGDPILFADYQNITTNLPLNGLLALVAIDDISIVAAPGAASGWQGPSGAPSAVLDAAQAINNAITTHCENLIYRTAALDTPAQFLPDDALNFRNLRSSTHAALYYPWITVSHPIDDSRIDVPPAAYMTGIWARSDNARGVIKAPANEVVRSALDFETRLNKPQQELLNPQGVNCLRFFPGPGFLVWGARTISDDPEWKYLSMRRYFNYVEKSIDEGTQWVVFEVNGPALWDAVRHTVEGFLLNEWRSGALLGAKPEKGFFVRCDASTMTADDLDQGRMICLIGIAAAKPAEFVIFRVSQITATTTA